MKNFILAVVFLFCALGEISAQEPKAPPTRKPPPSVALEEQSATRSGILFGAGMGVGVNRLYALDLISGKFPPSVKRFLILNANLKFGGHYFFLPSWGLNYYYSFDTTFTRGAPGWGPQEGGMFIRNQTHMFNLDAVYSAYSNDKLRVDVMLGFGIGISQTTSGLRDKEHNLQPAWRVDSSAIGPQVHVNLGTKVMFPQGYGVGFNIKIPTISFVTWDNKDRSEHPRVTSLPYLFYLDFIVEL